MLKKIVFSQEIQFYDGTKLVDKLRLSVMIKLLKMSSKQSN